LNESPPVNPFVIAVVLLLGAMLGVLVSTRRNAWRDVQVAWPFYAKTPLASPQQVLYQRLVSALPGHIVLSDVEMAEVVGVKRGFDFGLWSRRIRGLRYDFVVYAPYASVLTAIELDDKPRSAGAGTRADGIKQRASAVAGIRVVRWQSMALPDHATIRAALAESPCTEGDVASANQSWWPPLPSYGKNPPGL
jgi:hypothetical protein